MTPNTSYERPEAPTVGRAVAEGELIQPPTPTLPLGAGGPRERAAGRVFPAAVAAVAQVHEHDELLRLHAAAAAADLGFVVAADGSAAHPRRAGRPPEPSASGSPGPASVCAPAREDASSRAVAVCFVGLDGAEPCSRCRNRGGPDVCRGRTNAFFVGYTAGPPAVAAAHRLHACCDVVVLLRASGGRPCFAYPPPGVLAGSGLTPREADVLVLLLAGQTDAEVAARLCVARATARAHARAVLRKLGAADRRTLRVRLLGRPGAAPG